MAFVTRVKLGFTRKFVIINSNTDVNEFVQKSECVFFRLRLWSWSIKLITIEIIFLGLIAHGVQPERGTNVSLYDNQNTLVLPSEFKIIVNQFKKSASFYIEIKLSTPDSSIKRLVEVTHFSKRSIQNLLKTDFFYRILKHIYILLRIAMSFFKNKKNSAFWQQYISVKQCITLLIIVCKHLKHRQLTILKTYHWPLYKYSLHFEPSQAIMEG